MRRAAVYIVLATIIISTMEISGRILARDFNPTQVTFWRFLIGALVLLPIALNDLRARHFHPGHADVRFIVAAGFVGVAVSMVLFQMALEVTQASTVAVVVSCVPVGVIPFACLFLKERFTADTAWSLAFCLAGILCILDPLHLNPELRGIVLTIGVVVTFAAYSVMGKAKSGTWGSISFTCFSFLAGALILLVVIGLSYLLPSPAPGSTLAQFHRIPLLAGITWHNLPAFLYFAVVGTGILYALFFLAMERTSAAVGSAVFFFKPALAPVFAWILLGERIAGHTLAGIVLIVCGTFFVVRAARQLPHSPHALLERVESGHAD